MRAPGLSPLLLRPLARVLARIDADGTRFLSELGVDEHTPDDLYVDAVRVDRALDALAAERGDAAFGLTLAQGAASHPLGFFDHLVWPGATVRDAILRSARFYALLTTRASLDLEEHDGVAQLTQHIVPHAPRGLVLIDMAFASLVLRARAAADGLELRAMRFVHRPADAARYDEVFGVKVESGAPLDVLELDSSQLDRALGTADAITAAALEDRAMKMHGAAITSFVDDVRSLIRQHLAESENVLGVVAKALSLSERTVQRRLEQHGTSLRALVDEVRRELALSLLERGRPLAEVATELGFARSQAFHKAFVRWTGATPGTFRAR